MPRRIEKKSYLTAAWKRDTAARGRSVIRRAINQVVIMRVNSTPLGDPIAQESMRTMLVDATQLIHA
jgi:hypothetical protein